PLLARVCRRERGTDRRALPLAQPVRGLRSGLRTGQAGPWPARRRAKGGVRRHRAMNAWGQVREAAQRVVSRVAEAYRGQREERYGGEVIVAPEELLGNGTPDAVIERHLQRLTRD